MELASTDIVAWWGAILATSIFVWDIVKWRKHGPKLRLSVRPNSIYLDSKVYEGEQDENGVTEGYLKSYIHIEIVNTGTLPTTIMNISSSQKMDNGGTLGTSLVGFQVHFGKALPYLITPGDIWSCRLEQRDQLNNRSKSPLEICVDVSHLLKPLIKEVPHLNKTSD